MNISPLLCLILAPLAAIILILFKVPARPTALLATAFNLALSIGLLVLYPANGQYAFVMDMQWMSLPGLPPIHLHFGVDGISLPLVFLTAIVSFAAIAVSPGNIRRSTEFFCYLLLMSLGAMGAFISLDLFFFYIFHEFALIPTFLLIGIWGGQNRQFASFQITLYLMTGSLILLAGLLALILAIPDPNNRTFDMVQLQSYLASTPLNVSLQHIIFPLLLVGFGILVGLFPFHSWAPPGYASAPPAAAMMHAGVLKKFAIYGLIRVAVPMVHQGFEYWQLTLLCLLVGNFLYAGFVTLAQKELPTMLGFSSIMHMGYLFLGIAAWNTIGLTGAVILMVAHGLSAALLFGLSGEITQRSGENRFTELGGLAKRAPQLAVLFSFASMASMGVPGLANFAGEVMIFFGSYSYLTAYTIIAIYGTVITAIYQLRAIKTVFYGVMPARYEAVTAGARAGTDVAVTTGMTDVTTLSEYGPYALLVVASLVIGFMPFLLIHIVEPSVALLVPAK